MIQINDYTSKKITIIQFFCSIMVVMIHSYNLNQYFNLEADSLQYKIISFVENFISNGVARVAVPLFFIISAFLFFNGVHYTFRWFLTKYQKRIKSLLIPYMIWNIIGLLIYLIPYFIPSLRTFIPRYIDNITYKNIINGIFFYKYNFTFWFINNLIILIIFSPFIYLLLKNNILGKLFILLSLFTFILDYQIILIQPQSLCFFLIGSYLAIHKININNIKINKITSYLLLLVWFCLITISIITYNPFLQKISILLGILAVWFVYDFLNNKITIRKYMNYTFMIYAIHTFLLEVVKKTIIFFLGKTPIFSLINYFFAPIITITLIIFLSIFFKKTSPKVYNILTGLR